MVNKYVSSVLTLLSIRISASHSKYLYPVAGYKYILDGLHLVSNIYLVDIIWRHFLSVVMSHESITSHFLLRFCCWLTTSSWSSCSWTRRPTPWAASASSTWTTSQSLSRSAISSLFYNLEVATRFCRSSHNIRKRPIHV